MGKHDRDLTTTGKRDVTTTGKRDVSVQPSSGVPAMRKLMKNWKQFTKLMEEADALVKVRDNLIELRLKLQGREWEEKPPELWEAKLNEDVHQQRIARCQAMLKEIDPPEHYEADDNKVLKQEVIAGRLALMLGCVDTGPTNIEPEVFAPMMATHVYDANIHYPALLSGCKAIEQAQKPVRTIGQVLEILQQHQLVWWKRERAINYLPELARIVQAEIEQTQRKFEIEQAEQRLQMARQKTKHNAQSLRWFTEGIIRLQNAARESYQKIEQSFERVHELRRESDEAEIELREAEAALAVQQKALAAVQQKALAALKGMNGNGTKGDSTSDDDPRFIGYDDNEASDGEEAESNDEVSDGDEEEHGDDEEAEEDNAD